MPRTTIEDLHEPPSEYERLCSRIGKFIADHITAAEVSQSEAGIVRLSLPAIIPFPHESPYSYRALFGVALDMNRRGDTNKPIYTVEVGEEHRPWGSFWYSTTAGAYVTPDGYEKMMETGQPGRIHELIDNAIVLENPPYTYGDTQAY